MHSDEQSGWRGPVTSFQPGNHESGGEQQIQAGPCSLETDHDQGRRSLLIPPASEDSRFTSSDNAAKQAAGVEALTGQAALIIGHPGHELCVYGWCGLARPSVFILTDGSGRTETSRTARSVRILEGLGCTTGPGTGLLTDREVYQALLSRDHKLFTRLTRRIAEWLVVDDIDSVAGDAAEGFNSVHDACRLIIDAAVDLARLATNRAISNCAFRLDWRKDREYALERDGARTLILDQETFDSKLSAAWAYDELRSDIEAVLGENGVECFRTERFDPVVSKGEHRQTAAPYYEEYGARLVNDGIYNQVIRYNEHLAPLGDALALAVQEGL